MIIQTVYKVIKDKKHICNLNVFFEGSDNPKEDHEIIGVSLGDTEIGETNDFDKLSDGPLPIDI